MAEIKNQQKCYNSFSCILSVLIILFVVGSIAWDIMVTKPEMRKSIEEIKIEVRGIHEKIDAQFTKDSLTYQFLESTAQKHLSIMAEEEQSNKK